MANNWKTIWEKRTLNEEAFNSDDINELFVALKRADGFDVGGASFPKRSLYANTRISSAGFLRAQSSP